MPLTIFGLAVENIQKGNSSFENTPRKVFKHFFKILNVQFQHPKPGLYIINKERVIRFARLVIDERLQCCVYHPKLICICFFTLTCHSFVKLWLLSLDRVENRRSYGTAANEA
ncbi:hypothetical protein SO802_022784 [Lithocarpus litseifolius]|uniref:Uncharacterized protein n=1 Tax=Lithocarpus litseifolius TaxID=425828 RepID=A0AAW2C4E5_9ROSI